MTSITVEISNKSMLKKVITFFNNLELPFRVEEHTTTKNIAVQSELPPGCGAWEDDREPDEIIADIRAARYFNPQKENLSL
jgi:hypothetical protein